jgi:putative transposase
VTDKLKNYTAAKREVLPRVEHWQSRYLNNRAEVSADKTTRTANAVLQVSPSRATFPVAPQPDPHHFQLHRHRLPANDYRKANTAAFPRWRDVAAATAIV